MREAASVGVLTVGHGLESVDVSSNAILVTDNNAITGGNGLRLVRSNAGSGGGVSTISPDGHGHIEELRTRSNVISKRAGLVFLSENEGTALVVLDVAARPIQFIDDLRSNTGSGVAIAIGAHEEINTADLVVGTQRYLVEAVRLSRLLEEVGLSGEDGGSLSLANLVDLIGIFLEEVMPRSLAMSHSSTLVV